MSITPILLKNRIANSINDSNTSFPDEIEFNKVYKSVYYKYINRGSRDIRYKVINTTSENFIVEYYFLTDDYSVHNRIDENGKTVALENFEGQFGLPIYENKEKTDLEHVRIKAHNQNVFDILKSKGFK